MESFLQIRIFGLTFFLSLFANASNFVIIFWLYYII